MAAPKTRNTIRWLLRPVLGQQRHYWRVVLGCFIAASTFWLLNALNQEHTTRITYPVQFVYNERELMPLHPLPTQVTLNVSGKGWNLLRRQLGIGEDSQPALLPVQNLPEATFLTGSTLAPALRKVMRRLNLNYVVTDTINFRFDRRVQRQIKLQADSATLHLASGVRLASPIQIVPEKITLTGPAFLLDTLPETMPLRMPRQTVGNDFNETVALPFLQNPLIQSDTKHASVSFEVERRSNKPAGD